MSPHLTTDRLVLRRFTPDDVDLLVELDSDPEVMHFITGGRSTPRVEVVDDVLPHYLQWHERSDIYGFFAAVERSSGQFVGWVHFRPPADAPPDEPELGYRLRRAAWGKGYATEACRALIDSGFLRGDVSRVVAETMAVHTASRRLMEKCGMTLVRTFVADWPDPIPGDEHGDVEYALTRQEWEAQRVRAAQ